MSYSYSSLQRGSITAQVFSTFHDHSQFPSYVVQLTLMRPRKDQCYPLCRRIQRSFSRIDLAEAYHADVVLRLTEQKGYKLLVSSCK